MPAGRPATATLRERRQSVLVVDDHPLNRELMAACLEELEVEVLTAADGPSALDAVAEHAPDLVLLDVMMPGIDGFEVCRRIKSSPPGSLLPVVLVTALTQPAERTRGMSMGADDFIFKPIDRIELLVRVRSLLRMKSLHDRLDGTERVIFALARAVEAPEHGDSHPERVGRTARALAAAAGMAADELDDMYRGGALHDIGKVGVSQAILLKAGRLEPAEWEAVKAHVLIGQEMVSTLPAAPHLIPIVRHHHERFAGGGYPDGLAGEEIPLAARIVAVCDAFDAMTSRLIRHQGRRSADAAGTLRAGAGTQWDPGLVELFLAQVALRGPLAAPAG